MKILNSNQSTYPIPVQRWSGRPAPDARGLAPLTVSLGLCWQKTMEGSLLRVMVKLSGMEGNCGVVRQI